MKKEVFNCSGVGGTKKNVNVTFEINPDTQSLTFTQSGGILGKIVNYPKYIIYQIKSSDGTRILTNEFEYSWRNLVGKDLYYISYISTNDKKVWEYSFKGGSGDPYIFKDCNKVQ